MTDTKPIRRIAIVGTGVIGASWTALFLAKGLQVVATDIAPNAEASLRKFVETAWPALERLGLAAGASQSNLKFTADLAQAVAGVDLVQENGPERIDFKQKLYKQLDELLPPDAIIASSSSGLKMSEIQAGAASHPERHNRTSSSRPTSRRRSPAPTSSRRTGPSGSISSRSSMGSSTSCCRPTSSSRQARRGSR